METNEKIRIMQAYLDGRVIEIQTMHGDWIPVSKPYWNWEICKYRIQDEHRELIVVWNLLSNSLNYAVQDADGSVWAYRTIPMLDDSKKAWVPWRPDVVVGDLTLLPGIVKQKASNWKESLIERH